MTEPVNNDILRLLIREAVEREMSMVVAPLRSGVQIVEGTTRHLDKEIGALTVRVDQLDDLVRGNPKQHLIGLAQQIEQQSALINTLHAAITTAVEGVKDQLREDIAKLRENQTKADQDRAAILNQWRGAKYALSALAVVTGVANFENVAKLIAGWLT